MEKIKLEARQNSRDVSMYEIYDSKSTGRNILWCAVHGDFFVEMPEAVKKMQNGETVNFTLTCDN